MRILIVGAGWVGTHAASSFLEQGHSVFSLSRTESRWEQSKVPHHQRFMIDFDSESPIFPPDLPKNFDAVLISIPHATNSSDHPAGKRLDHLIQFLHAIRCTTGIYLSSVGIYPDQDGIFTEEEPLPVGSDLLREKSEKTIAELFERSFTLRLGGIFGKDRIFAKYFSQKICRIGEQKANFIHLDDIIASIYCCLDFKINPSIYNLVTPEHPTKRAVIEASAVRHKLTLPTSFEKVNSFNKVVSSEKWVKETGFRFKYPNPIDF
jgi:nucleoside-diphosphate-sugar epimerase